MPMFNPGNTPRIQDILGNIPRHGYRGELFPEPPGEDFTRSALCISREYGARGGTLARKMAKKLGWQIYEREMLEYMARTPTVFDELHQLAGPKVLEWAEFQWNKVNENRGISVPGEIQELAKVILLVSSMGNAVFLGRGAGFILPSPNRVHVRIASSFEDRVAYVCQYDRLTQSEASQKVRRMDEKREEFLVHHFPPVQDPLHCFDMVLHSGALGLETCLSLINNLVQARLEKTLEV